MRRRAMFITSRASSAQRAAQQVLLAIAQPLLGDLIAADRVLPDVGRDVLPVGRRVQVHVASGRAQEGQGLIGGEAAGGGRQ